MPPTPAEFRQNLQAKTNGKNEKDARKTVEQALSSAQFRGSCTKAAARIDNAAVTLYIWKGSPGGDLVLAVGSSFRLRILELGDLTEDGPGKYSLVGTRLGNTGPTPLQPLGRSAPVAALPTPAPKASAGDEVRAIETAVVRAGLTPVPVAVTPKEDLDDLKRRLAGVIATYAKARDALDSREMALLETEEKAAATAESLRLERTNLDAVASQIDHKKDALATQTAAQAVERTSLAAVRADLAHKLAALVEREETLQQRESDADAGFLGRRDEVLASLDAAHQELLAQNVILAKALETARQKHAADLQVRESAHRQRLEEAEQIMRDRAASRESDLETAWLERSEPLDAREGELRVREAAAVKALQRAGWAQEEADALREHVAEHIEERARGLMADLESELAHEKSRTTALRERCGGLERQLEQRRDAELALGHETPEEIQRRIQALQTRISDLESQLVNRPSTADAAELHDLRDAQSRWQDERRSVLKDLSIARRQLETRNIDVDEVEILRDRNAALKENQRLLQAALDDLRSDIDERLDKHRDQPVFPELLRMDADAQLREPTSLFFSPTEMALDLAELSSFLQNRMGKAPGADQPELFYRLEEIRAFLGGLAMSRLHLLQGISGIGKSSLPRRFAEAVGGRCETISVQAGWRDRNDLLGYYNAFERRYYESPFVQALYKAQTPQYRDRIFLVLLDEMNLSHPEQYAADVLDVLARDVKADRRFELMSATQPGRAPAGIDDGRYLPLPENVWFVGTANHDETTKDFADKTYDRSFVLALPGAPKSFKLKSERQRYPLAFSKIMEAFDTAAKTHADDAEKSLEWMKEQLRGPMVDHFGVGWGGRLESHARRFIPVVRAAGGTLGEALDQMVATRVLRRIQGRHDLMEEDVREVLGILENSWPDKKTPAVEGPRMLRRELKRLGADL